MLSAQQSVIGAPTKLAQAAITTSPVAIYTVDANNRSAIEDIVICNTTAAAINVNVFAGSASTTANAIFYGTSVGGNSMISWNGRQILNALETITVSASGAGLTISVSGLTNV